MSRKDPAQDLERPHFYSQFWIDVANGKRDVSAGRAAEADMEVERSGLEEQEVEPFEELAPKPAPKKVAKTEKKPEPVRPTITSLADLANIDLLMKNSAAMEGEEVPDLETGEVEDFGPFGAAPAEEPAIVTDIEFEGETEPEAEAEAAEEFGDLDFEEEDEWEGGRKPSKPSKPTRKRERRGPGF